MSGDPVDQLFVLEPVQHGLDVAAVVAAQILELPGGADVKAPVVSLAGPVIIALPRRFSLHRVVGVKEAGQVAHVEVGAPFLLRFAGGTAHPEGHDNLGLSFVEEGAVSDQDLADVIVTVGAAVVISLIQRVILHVL